jgi:hypothetical protein
MLSPPRRLQELLHREARNAKENNPEVGASHRQRTNVTQHARFPDYDLLNPQRLRQ